MKPIALLLSLLALTALMSVAGCYSTYEAEIIHTAELQPQVKYPEQAKVYLSNNNILVFKDGFILEDNHLRGEHQAFDYTGLPIRSQEKVTVDSIIAITRFVETTTDAMRFAGFLGTITGVPLTVMAIYCLACPKCCFGSCPTVYVPSDGRYTLQAELFSKCISQQLEDHDLVPCSMTCLKVVIFQ